MIGLTISACIYIGIGACICTIIPKKIKIKKKYAKIQSVINYTLIIVGLVFMLKGVLILL